MTSVSSNTAVPRAGMLATVRNRRGVVVAVEPFDGGTGRLHLVHLEYKDDQSPTAERVLWELELERGRSLLEPTELPDPSRAGPMSSEDFDALLRAARWTALSPYVDPGTKGRLSWEPVASPFFGGVKCEDYQIVPLLQAIRMPRVSLLIADDVGLGKTVEAGLILTELMLRRRIRRILVLAPASLRQQWIDELWDKFSLQFEVVGRQEVERHRRRFGMDSNPWRSFDRIVASYHYLRQPDVREQFLSACRTPEGSTHLPWDLLIVDECHNLMPSPFGEDSELCQTLRLVAPQFEHRLFLSATPHNGHTRSFTGLLEMLDPVRFSRTSEMTRAMRKRIDEVLIRRLKRDINCNEDSPRFCNRLPPKAIELHADARELALSHAFDLFRKAVHSLVRDSTKQRRRAGTFAVEILGKRMLSNPVAFAESWRRARQGLIGDVLANEPEVSTAEHALRRETTDDREIVQREASAATVAGAWLKTFDDQLNDEIAAIENALTALGFDLESENITEQTPVSDVRFDSLVALVRTLLCEESLERNEDIDSAFRFRVDERLIVFTEYKTTLDYLARRLRQLFGVERVLTLFGGGELGGMDSTGREEIKSAFNDPDSSARVLLATDAASEGLNLHRTSRYLLHFDCPWNPFRLEQRNGRIDRYGQARDVIVHHFVSNTDPDLRFLDHVIRKANEIRNDLGSVNEIFDQAMHSRFIRGENAETVRQVMEQSIESVLGRDEGVSEISKKSPTESLAEAHSLETMAAELDLDERALGNTLEAAMAISGGRPQLMESDQPGCYRVMNPDLPGWLDIIDSSVRIPVQGGGPGPVPKLAFGASPFIERYGDLNVFQPRPDSLLIHLGHPLMQRALGVLARHRYPGTQQVSRWTVRCGKIPPNVEAVVLFSVEEIAVNELRETFHRWVRTVAFPIRGRELGEPLSREPDRVYSGAPSAKVSDAIELLEDASTILKTWLEAYKTELTNILRSELRREGRAALAREDERYRSREGEVSKLIEESTVGRLQREISYLKLRSTQGRLFDHVDGIEELQRSIELKKSEIARRRAQNEELREQLRCEHKRILRQIPRRFSLSGEAQVLPVAVELRLPEGQP